MFGDGYNLFQELDNCFFFHINLFFTLKEHFYTSDYQKYSEYVYNPVEVLYHLDTCEYEYGAHDQGSDDSPEEYLMLVYLFDIKIAKYHDEYKEIVDAQRFFYNISSQELQCFFAPHPKIDDDIKNHGKRDPYYTPGYGFFYLYLMSFFVENSQVHSEHDKNKYKKSYPIIHVKFHKKYIIWYK